MLGFDRAFISSETAHAVVLDISKGFNRLKKEMKI